MMGVILRHDKELHDFIVEGAIVIGMISEYLNYPNIRISKSVFKSNSYLDLTVYGFAFYVNSYYCLDNPRNSNYPDNP